MSAEGPASTQGTLGEKRLRGSDEGQDYADCDQRGRRVEVNTMLEQSVGASDKFSSDVMPVLPMSWNTEPTGPAVDSQMAENFTSNPVLEPIPESGGSFNIDNTKYSWRVPDEREDRDRYVLQHPSRSMGSLAWMGIPENKETFDAKLGNLSLSDEDKVKLVETVTLSNPFFLDGFHEFTLYVRNRYYPYVWGYIRRKMLSGTKRFVVCVVGQPGIGKSEGVGNYLAAAALSHAATMDVLLKGKDQIPEHAKLAVKATADLILVVIEMEKTSVLYGGKQYKFSALDPYWRVDVVNCVNGLGSSASSVLILHDCKSGRDTTAPFLLQSTIYAKIVGKRRAQVGLVYLASPQVGNFSVCIEKMPGKNSWPPTYIYLPVWSYDEMEALSKSSNDPSFKDNYHICGGVLRDATRPNRVEAEIQKEGVKFDIASFAVTENLNTCSSQLACIVPNDDFNDPRKGLTFRSDRAWERVLQMKGATTLFDIRTQLLQNVPQAYKGYNLEHIFSALLVAVVDHPAGKSGKFPLMCKTISEVQGVEDVDLGEILRDVEKKHFFVRAVSVKGNKFGNIASEARRLAKEADNKKKAAVLVKMADDNAPLVDFMLLIREWSEEKISVGWKAYAFQVTVAARHPAQPIPETHFKKSFPLVVEKDDAQIQLAAFIYVGYSLDGVTYGVQSKQFIETPGMKNPAQDDKETYFSDHQYRMTIQC